MLKLEQQVCSLELAKRLKELNVKQESFFIWKQCINKQLACYQIPTVSTHKNVDNDDEIIASAFTVAELGEMLKEKCPMAIEGENLVAGKWNIDSFTANTEADARALCLIYLLENGLLKL